MSYLQFPQKRSIQVFDTGETLGLGGFQPASNGELAHVRVNLYARGTVSGLWEAKVGIHLNENFDTAYAESTAIFLTSVGAEIDGSPTGDWIAMVRFDFNRPNLNKNQLYYLSVTLPGYTRTGDTNYMGVVRDQPYPVYGSTTSNIGWNSPAHTTVFAYQVSE